MNKGNLDNGPMMYTGELAPIMISQNTFGNSKKYNVDKVSGDLRFFYSLGHADLTTNGQKQFISERTAIKVHPGAEVHFDMKKGTKLYEIQVQKSEEQVLNDLTAKYKWFFDGLTGEDKREWELSVNAGKDFININEELNSQKISAKYPGILIAPAFSRFNDAIPNGWHFMYMRASKILGVGTDANYRMRDQEGLHRHKVTVETYICLGGKLELIVDGQSHVLPPGGFLTAVPGEAHAMGSFKKIPYEGITLQHPSLPGDKFDMNGILVPRYVKK